MLSGGSAFGLDASAGARSWLARAGRGLAYERMGRRAEAVESYQRALTVDSGNQVARSGMSRMGARA